MRQASTGYRCSGLAESTMALGLMTSFPRMCCQFAKSSKLGVDLLPHFHG